MTALNPETIRPRFPGLNRTHEGRPCLFFDGPAGSQVSQGVIDAVTHYYMTCNANHGGHFATSHESDAIYDAARRKASALLGADSPDEIVFGANMTTQAFALARALSREWHPGDEILVTRLDHDANVSPWVRAAEDRGVTVRHIDIRPEDCTLDPEIFRLQLSSKTKLLAVGAVSNAVGTRNPIAEMTRLAHEAGALVAVDAVHHVPHLPIDVMAWDADFVFCSAYKFFGPHVGVMYAKRAHLERLAAYKVRPSPNIVPDRWMTGTANYEGIAGVGACIDYLIGLGRELSPPGELSERESILACMSAIEGHEREIGGRMLMGLLETPGIKVYGITDPNRWGERVPTFSFTHERIVPTKLAKRLGERGIFVWSGNYYALPLTERLGLEPNGMVRVGLLHYATSGEVDRFLAELRAFLSVSDVHPSPKRQRGS